MRYIVGWTSEFGGDRGVEYFDDVDIIEAESDALAMSPGLKCVGGGAVEAWIARIDETLCSEFSRLHKDRVAAEELLMIERRKDEERKERDRSIEEIRKRIESLESGSSLAELKSRLAALTGSK